MKTAQRLFARRPAPSAYGTYKVLDPSSALEAYPAIRPVPESIPRPEYVPDNLFAVGWGYHSPVRELRTPSQEEGRLRTEEDAQRVRDVAKLAAEVLSNAGRLVKPGVTTDDIDLAVHEMIVARGAYPSPLGYTSFPRSITTSVNNVIAHGIPDSRPLDETDIINIDLTLYLNGYHGDTSRTFLLPKVDSQGVDLVEATKEALNVGIRVCGPGVPLSEIGRAIGDFATKSGFSVNEQFSGHGIGKRFHQYPWILHFPNGEPGEMHPGDCFTIEPCLVQGHNSRGFMWDDGWTLSTESGARSAQFEHQILITEDGYEILTRHE